MWTIRPCVICGRGVKCEPGYPADVHVVCWPCIMGEYYNFDGEPITMYEWAELWHGDRHVAVTKLGDAEVSTVWLGLDHRFIGDGPPLIYESMVFGGILDGERDRYPNWNAALAGHDQLVAQVSASQRVDGRIGTD